MNSTLIDSKALRQLKTHLSVKGAVICPGAVAPWPAIGATTEVEFAKQYYANTTALYIHVRMFIGGQWFILRTMTTMLMLLFSTSTALSDNSDGVCSQLAALNDFITHHIDASYINL